MPHARTTLAATLALASTAAGLLFGGSALAQSGLITVDIRSLAPNMAQNLSVEVSQIPRTVQVPVSLAASVCGIDQEVLARQETGGVCTATSTNSALDQTVQAQIRPEAGR